MFITVWALYLHVLEKCFAYYYYLSVLLLLLLLFYSHYFVEDEGPEVKGLV